MSILDAPRKLIEEFDLSNFFASYPFFPRDVIQEDYEFVEYMNTCVSIVEKWVYTQGFFGRSFYSIPDRISYVMFEEAKTTPGNPKRTVSNTPPFCQLLFNLAGRHFQTNLESKQVPADETARATYLYGLYGKALNLLTDLGACFSYISPEFMMDYQMYCIYMQSLPSEIRAKSIIKVSNMDEFHELSKQCWLDVILQTYKALMLSRLIVGHKGVINVSKVTSTPEEKFRSAVKNISKNNHLFSTTELLLLNWLEFHYNEMRNTMWIGNTCLVAREITIFGDSISDGFVYAAITITYCPYLAAHFDGLITEPLNYEENLHNNIKVIEAWKILNFSLGVTVQDLVKPHSLRTLFIIVYLYEVLPSMYPSENLEFRIGLSQRLRKSLTIKNNNSFTVAYKAILYQNDGDCFETEHAFYVIAPKSKCHIYVTFWAKFIRQVRCTLILSGECPGYYYGKSTVVTLIGAPDLSYVKETIEISLGLYKVEEILLPCRSPYMVKSQHSVQFTSKECTTADEVKALLRRRDYPKYFVTRLCSVESNIEFDDDGVGSVNCILVCLTVRTVPMWLYFRNSSVGDFVMKVVTSCSSFLEKEILNVLIPRGKGRYPNRKHVQLMLEVPCQNKLLWNALIRGFLKTCTTDLSFWRDQIYTTTGMDILQKVLKVHLLGFDTTFCGRMMYKIKKPKNANIILPNTFVIEDECSSESVTVPMQLIDTRKLPNGICIELESENGFYKRNYYLKFTFEQSEDDLLAEDEE